jgi:hypothetical protein
VNEALAWRHEQVNLLQAYDALFELRRHRVGWIRRISDFFAGSINALRQ